MKPGDVLESFSDIDKSVEMLGLKQKTNSDVVIPQFISWFRDYYHQ